MAIKEVERGVYETKDYGIFKYRPLGENREIDQRNLIEKKKSIKLWGLLVPISVTRGYEIIDGQHRFLACKELGVPVRFVYSRDLTIDELAEMNKATKRWQTKEIIHAKALAGNDNYRYLDCLIGEFDGFTVNQILRAMGKSNILSEDKTITLEDYERGRRVLLDTDMVLAVFKDKAPNRAQKETILALIATKTVSAKFLKDNLKRRDNYKQLSGYAKMKDTVNDLEAICNLGLQQHHRDYFASRFKANFAAMTRKKMEVD